jgi:hypothetical protein
MFFQAGTRKRLTPSLQPPWDNKASCEWGVEKLKKKRLGNKNTSYYWDGFRVKVYNDKKKKNIFYNLEKLFLLYFSSFSAGRAQEHRAGDCSGPKHGPPTCGTGWPATGSRTFPVAQLTSDGDWRRKRTADTTTQKKWFYNNDVLFIFLYFFANII